MAVTVKIPAQLRGVTEGEGEIEVDGGDRRRGARRRLRAARRASRADHRGRRAAPVRERLRLRRGHPLPGRARDEALRRRRGHDPAGRRRRLAITELAATRRRSRQSHNLRRRGRHRPGGDPVRRARHASAGAHARDSQGAGGDRRQADPLARGPHLRRPGAAPLPAADGLPRRDDRGVRARRPSGRSRSRSTASIRGSTPPPEGGSRWRASASPGGPFCVTYADGVADLDLEALVAFHRGHGELGTVTVVRPRTQFGVADLDEDDRVLAFEEKPRLDHWVNGGFFCFEPGFLDYLAADSVLENEPLRRLAAAGQLRAFRHTRLLGLHGHLQGRSDAQRPVGRRTGAVGRVGAAHRSRGRCPLAPAWSPADAGSSVRGSATQLLERGEPVVSLDRAAREGRPSALGAARDRRTRSSRWRVTSSTRSSCGARWRTTG